MGMIGRYIDSRTDAEKDALIQHPDPTYDGGLWLEEWNGRECGCLVGTCRDARGRHFNPSVDEDEPGAFAFFHVDWAGIRRTEAATTEHAVGYRFPVLTKRFGPERIWRAVKMRAAKSYTPNLEVQHATAEHAVAE